MQYRLRSILLVTFVAGVFAAHTGRNVRRTLEANAKFERTRQELGNAHKRLWHAPNATSNWTLIDTAIGEWRDRGIHWVGHEYQQGEGDSVYCHVQYGVDRKAFFSLGQGAPLEAGVTLIGRCPVLPQIADGKIATKSVMGNQQAVNHNGKQYFLKSLFGDMHEWKRCSESDPLQWYRLRSTEDVDQRPVLAIVHLLACTGDASKGERLVQQFVTDVWPECAERWNVSNGQSSNRQNAKVAARRR